jgi:thiaminase (transcriptional activator TenA)
MRMPKRCPSRSVEPLRRPRIFTCSTAVSFVPVKGDSVVRLDGAAGPRPALAEATVSFFEHLKTEASAEWRAYTEHPFPTGMAEGTLSEAAFRHYLVQDYLFLIEFARAYALAVYKSRQLSDMREAASGLSAILAVEMNLHVKLCAGWGLSPADLERAPPAAETLAYTRYVLDAGMRGDLLTLKVALAPCVVGYAEIAARLAARPDARAATNPYRIWIDEYAGAPYQEVAAKARAQLDRLAGLYATPAREAELIAVFKEATRLETNFWEMGWRAGLAVE